MNEKQFQQTLRRAFLFPFAVGVLLAAVLIAEVQFLVSRSEWVEHTNQAISLSQQLFRLAIDEETSLRAYVLTRDKRFLDPCHEGDKLAPTMQQELRQLVADSPEETARHQKAIQAFQAWAVWADEAIAITDAGGWAGGVQFQLRGKKLMDEYRRKRSEFIEGEERLREERLARSRQTIKLLNFTIIALSILLALGFAVLGRKQLLALSRSFNQALASAQTSAAEAKAQQDRLAGIIGSAMDAIITVDESQHIQVFNRAAEQIFRCSASQALGQTLDRFIPERFREVHRHHVENFEHTGITNRTMSRPGTLWGRRSDGEEFPIEATISQVKSGDQKLFTVVLRDVTERKEAESRIAEQARLLDQASDAIIVRDDEGRIASWNRGAQVIYGWTPEEADGKLVHDLMQTRFPEPLTEIVNWVRKHGRWEGELEQTRKNGDRVTVLSRWMQVFGAQDTNDHRPLMEINTDITRRKQLEAALQANERLALTGRLSACIAHEINNPLDTVANVLFLVEQQYDGESEARRLINTAQREVQRIMEISRNMLNLHREKRTPSPIKVSELLASVVALVDETIAKGRRNIQIQPGFKGEVEGFPAELLQVFTNILKNAVEATQGGGYIRISSEAASESGQEGVLIRVADDGCGIPEVMQAKLFSPFVSTKEAGGTGLGLWVSRSILQKHGGTIRIASTVGGSQTATTVSIFLPLRRQARSIKSDWN